MANAAGADLADLEFCQFHPTALSAPGTKSDGMLVTEAVRGEGARLLGADGERFTDELAPRDAVTLAVLDQMKRDGAGHVLLDMRELPEARFPSVFAALREAGYDPLREPIPVAPASHYVMGGIAADLEGRSSLPGCSRSASAPAPGCTARTASPRTRSPNASCSGPARRPRRRRSPRRARRRSRPPGASIRRRRRPGTPSGTSPGPSAAPRSSKRLLSDPYPLARLIARFALEREESRGSHRRLEFPERDPALDEQPPRLRRRRSCAGRPGSRRAYLKNWSRAYLKVLNSCLTLLTFGHA